MENESTTITYEEEIVESTSITKSKKTNVVYLGGISLKLNQIKPLLSIEDDYSKHANIVFLYHIACSHVAVPRSWVANDRQYFNKNPKLLFFFKKISNFYKEGHLIVLSFNE